MEIEQNFHTNVTNVVFVQFNSIEIYRMWCCCSCSVTVLCYSLVIGHNIPNIMHRFEFSMARAHTQQRYKLQHYNSLFFFFFFENSKKRIVQLFKQNNKICVQCGVMFENTAKYHIAIDVEFNFNRLKITSGHIA